MYRVVLKFICLQKKILTCFCNKSFNDEQGSNTESFSPFCSRLIKNQLTFTFLRNIFQGLQIKSNCFCRFFIPQYIKYMSPSVGFMSRNLLLFVSSQMYTVVLEFMCRLLAALSTKSFQVARTYNRSNHNF